MITRLAIFCVKRLSVINTNHAKGFYFLWKNCFDGDVYYLKPRQGAEQKNQHNENEDAMRCFAAYFFGRIMCYNQGRRKTI